MNESDLMGGNNDEFKARLSREKQMKAKKELERGQVMSPIPSPPSLSPLPLHLPLPLPLSLTNVCIGVCKEGGGSESEGGRTNGPSKSPRSTFLSPSSLISFLYLIFF